MHKRQASLPAVLIKMFKLRQYTDPITIKTKQQQIKKTIITKAITIRDNSDSQAFISDFTCFLKAFLLSISNIQRKL